MAEEPSKKKMRVANEPLLITLNISEYPLWVQNLPNEELVIIFEIGVKVKESFTMTLIENEKCMEKALESQMKPICEEIKSIGEKMSSNVQDFSKHMREIKEKVVDDVNEVAKKVLPVDHIEKRVNDQIEKSEKRVVESVKECKRKLDKMSALLVKPKSKGSHGEMAVSRILKANFTTFTVNDVSGEGGKGDIHVESARSNHFLIEVKSYENSVPKNMIDRFKKDVAKSPEVKVGIMLSLTSGIANTSRNGKFEVQQHGNQYLIFVPNAMDEESLIVWSVVMADEIAGLHRELNESQSQKLKQLCDRFQDHVKLANTCRQNLEALKKTMESLESSLDPILKIISNAKKDITKIFKST
jgi:uncharacterized protein YoxC